MDPVQRIIQWLELVGMGHDLGEGCVSDDVEGAIENLRAEVARVTKDKSALRKESD